MQKLLDIIENARRVAQDTDAGQEVWNALYVPRAVTDSIRTLTDSEFAVTCDALRMARDEIRGKGMDTPNIDTALAKFEQGITPSTRGITFALNG